MLTLFLRAILLYGLVFLVLRLTGKRQVSDLQPFDLLITLLIADLASCAIADVSIPLVYSVVPILAVYLAQQLITRLCLKSAAMRRVICGSPVILVNDGVVQEEAMRETSYTVIDLLDQLRAKDVFDLDEVAYAILETNGSMSVLQKGAFMQPTVRDLHLAPQETALCYMLILDGALCRSAMRRLNLSESWICARLNECGVKDVGDVFFMQLAPDGALRLQLRARLGAKSYALKTEKTTHG